MFCPNCGTKNDDGAAFCANCGTGLKGQAGSASTSAGAGAANMSAGTMSSSPSGTPPKNWLIESILVTLFCCLPFGIAGIVNASKVESRFASGDVAGAQKAAEEAAKWTKIGFFVGIGVTVLYVIFMVVAGAASGGF